MKQFVHSTKCCVYKRRYPGCQNENPGQMGTGGSLTKKSVWKQSRALRLLIVFAALVPFILWGGATIIVNGQRKSETKTRTPIKHVIIIIGENRTFDSIFATYKAKPGETVDNLLSKGIIRADGSPGPNYSLAEQYSANVKGTAVFQLSPTRGKVPYSVLPAPLNGGPENACKQYGLCGLDVAKATENGLPEKPVDYYRFLLTGGTGLKGKVPDSRIQGVHAAAPYSSLPPGPFQITNSSSLPYDSYAASPVHRFYQMWQELDCNASYGTAANPSGCRADLFAWTEVTVGAGSNGRQQPRNFSTTYAPGKVTTGEGATALAFYNMLQGDAPYTKYLADHYAMSDNYHQPVMGGTGANHIMLAFGDLIWFSDENGHPMVPPHKKMTFAGGPVDEIENPNPAPGTNNWWIQDGYGGRGNAKGSHGVYGGGSYTDCSDPAQPGVAPILNYLKSLKPPIKSNCEPGRYYLLNNYHPGYFGDGSNAYRDTNSENTPFTIPGTTQRSIADVLLAHGTSWKYYDDQWNRYLRDKYQLNFDKSGPQSDRYCAICNPFQFQKQIMTNAVVRTAHLVDTEQLYKDIQAGTLPAVSFVKPSGWVDGHPASSKWNLFEGFVRKIVDQVKSKTALWDTTAIFITTDEGGGYYDSGYVQPLDFFGDGTRIPLIVVSRYAKAGYISHTYADHVSILKFIERNWYLSPITNRSRDNLPDPVSNAANPYVPVNRPAIGDLFDLFQF